jgi:hypothetical protein
MQQNNWGAAIQIWLGKQYKGFCADCQFDFFETKMLNF